MLLLVGAAGVGAQLGWIRTVVVSEQSVLAAALTDWESPDKRLATTAPGGFTVFSVGAERPTRTVVFIGDSHVEQYWPRVQALRQRLADSAMRVAFITRAGCPPLPSIERLDRPRLRCLDFTRAAYAYARRPEVTGVVFGARWEGYFQSLYSAVDPAVKPPLPLYYAPGTSHDTLRLDSPEGRQVAQEFANVLAGLRAQGKDVAVIESNPSDARFDPRMMLDPLTRRRRAVVPIPVDAFRRFLAPVAAFLRYATGDGARARMVDPIPALCPRNECTMVDSAGVPLYRDQDHIRAGMARRLTVVDSILWPTAR